MPNIEWDHLTVLRYVASRTSQGRSRNGFMVFCGVIVLLEEIMMASQVFQVSLTLLSFLVDADV
jgi:hypothetical protein